MAQAPSPHMCGRHLLVWGMSVTSSPLSALAASTCVAAVQLVPSSAHACELVCPLSHEADPMPHPPLSGVGTTSGTGSPTASGSGPTGHASSALSVCPHYERCPVTC
jgi:hypothetical protein